MIARTLHFTRADIMDMDFTELVQIWCPEAERIIREENGQ